MNIKKKITKLNSMPEIESWKSLMNAYRSTLSILEKKLSEHGCSVARFQILYFLYFEGSLVNKEIAIKTNVSVPNISTFMTRMIQDGLIVKKLVDGKKRPCFEISNDGIIFFEDIFLKHASLVSTLIPIFPVKFLKLLKSIEANNTIIKDSI